MKGRKETVGFVEKGSEIHTEVFILEIKILTILTSETPDIFVFQ